MLSYVDNLQRKNDNPDDTTILYENDDPSVSFEVMRLSYHPQSYADFENAARRIIKTESENTGYRKISSTSFIDSVTPNTTYYYIFRAYDAHDHVSYPSALYAVELVENDGAVYPNVRTVSFLGDETRKTNSKKLRRFLQIKPQITQVVLNTAALADETSYGEMNETAHVGSTLPMGLDEELVWGRKFKIRLTSKKTGRKVDLNITFKKDYDDTRNPPSSA